jgi:hypothetical protein
MTREVRYDDGSRDCITHCLVERAHQRPMVCLFGCVGRVDARRLRLHRVSVNHRADRQGIRRAGARSGGGVDDHAVDAASRRHRQRVARRPNWPQDAADDLDRLVFGLQLPGRLGAELLSAVPLPGLAWHRHGRGMAGRRRPRDGDMAGAIARLHGRRDAGLVGDRVLVVECDLWAVLQLHRLAWPADDRHRACPADHLYPAIRQRTGDLGREPTSAEGAKPPSAGTTILDLQARDGWETRSLPA